MAQKLNTELLNNLPSGVSGLGYDRSALTAGIVHVGVGNFHRAHQAIYLNRLFALQEDHDWAIIGAGIKPYDAAMRDKLAAQDFLTTIVELDPTGLNAQICGSMIDFLTVDPATLIDGLSDAAIKIVSLTVTEGGYYVDAKTGNFDLNNAEIQTDIASGDLPKTVFGILIAALKQRRANGIAPFTVMSCDNLPENGHVAKQAVVGLARAKDEAFADWIEANVAFPNGMVDCITPATSAREIEMVSNKFGIVDASPVACEPFRQWVLEDKFTLGRPQLEKVGVEFVDDVAPYELMKLRILNGGHAAIAYPSALMGHVYVHEGMRDPRVTGFLKKLENEEIIPTVPQIEGVSFDAYFEKVQERFANEAVGDTIARLCLDGSNRQPKFILPTIQDRLAQGLSVDGLALEVALWCRYCAGVDDNGNAIKIDDMAAERLKDHAMRAKENPAIWLEMTDIVGNLGDNTLFVEAFSKALNDLWQNGTEAVLKDYIGL